MFPLPSRCQELESSPGVTCSAAEQETINHFLFFSFSLRRVLRLFRISAGSGFAIQLSLPLSLSLLSVFIVKLGTKS